MSEASLIRVILKAIDKARPALLRDFGEVERLQVSQKGTANFVSNADLRTEQILIEELTAARKGWGFLCEEAGEKDLTNCTHRFVIDPIDGTTNFIHAIPYFCISVAAQKRTQSGDFETIVGIIADPLHDEIFVAEAGQGATVNHKKLQVAGKREHLLVSTAAPRPNRPHFDLASSLLTRLTHAGITVRCSGAAALDLAYVAAGRYDAMLYPHLRPWDVAAGKLLVQEAGGLLLQLQDASGESLEHSVLAVSKSSAEKMKLLIGLTIT
jgi:myo-inositol-1(or 4)-monophosphatase